MRAKITPEKIARFRQLTQASEMLAIAYLEAEEGDLSDAVISYFGDRS